MSARVATKHSAFIHPDPTCPPTLEEYRRNPGTKLDIAIKILQHHLQLPPNRPLLVNKEKGQSIEDPDVFANWSNELVEEPHPSDRPHDGTPDKIVLYQAFPSHNDFVVPVGLLNSHLFFY